MDKKTILSRKEGIMTADMNGSTVMMDTETGKYYNLGDTGGAIWRLLESPLSMEALVEGLTKEYDVTAEQCEKDIMPFLTALINRGLLTAE